MNKPRAGAAWSAFVIALGFLAQGCARPKPKPTEPPVRGNDLGVAHVEGRAAVSDDALNRQRILAEAREVFQTIYFPLDQSTLDTKARYTLTAIHRFMRTQPKLSVTIAGHGDERGTEVYNLALGERRAQAVLRYLTDLGAPGASMKSISYGEERPAETGSTEVSWAKNRRVEFAVELSP